MPVFHLFEDGAFFQHLFVVILNFKFIALDEEPEITVRKFGELFNILDQFKPFIQFLKIA